ncbi:unnamed protein product [Musa hybrid cultivar]
MTAHRKPSAAAAPPLDDDLFSYYFSFFNDGAAPSAMDPNPGKRPRVDDPSSSRRHVFSKPSESSSPSSSSADEEDEALQRPEQLPPQPQQQQRRVWVRDRSSDWWDRYIDPELPDIEFRRAFRMSRATFDFLCDELGSAVAKEDTALRAAIPVRQRVAVCVWRLATGEPLRLVSRRFGLGISTCHKLVLEVCAAIRNVLMPRSLAWPDSAGAAAAAARFEALSGIPNVVGAMYTTHIPVIAPRVSVAAYFNRRHTERNQKSSYTVTLQGVVDPDGVFTDVCIGWPGSMPDDQVLEKSALYQRANSGLLNNQWIVGGTGHALLDWVLVPYAQANLTWAQHAFNEKVGAVQRVAKDAFARLKGRWGCLQKRTEVKLKDLPVVLGACCVLHNLCEMRKEEMEPELRFELLDDEMVADNGLRSFSAIHFRDSIAHNLFHHGLSGTKCSFIVMLVFCDQYPTTEECHHSKSAESDKTMSEEDRVGLVNALKDKLQSLAGKHTDVLETLSAAVRKRVEVLREIQNQHDELEAKFFEERAVLEAKYQKLYEPLYTKRYEIVNGVVEVDGIKNESSVETLAEDKASEEKGVPDFWLTALKTNEVLAEEIQERDEEALKYLKDIKWCRIDNPKGFKLDFFFNSNPYFKNSVLTKTYHMIDEHEPILEKAIGTDIEWFPGKCVTQKIVKKKPKKGSKNAKPITKTEDCESFFNFFNPPEVPDDDADIDEETAEQLQSQMELDYDIGSTIRDKIIPHAVSWFTGEAVQDDDAEIEDDEDGEDEEDEDEDEDDEDEDDEDEDEEENGKSKKKSATRQKKSGGEQVDRPAECKQQ